MMPRKCLTALVLAALCVSARIQAQEPPPASAAVVEEAAASDSEDAAALAKKLSNPIAALISVPLQLNYDKDMGPLDKGYRTTLNIQPVIPIGINEDWNVISRTILPVIYQHEIIPGSGYQTELGDTLQSLFFSPVKPAPGGVIWGVGPVFLLPTATDDLTGGDKWAAGPTAVFLKQTGPWTVGFLGNHLWSFAGEDDRPEVNQSFLQPFLAYTTRTATTFNVNTESTYNWVDSEWGVPINISVSQMFKIGKQPLSIQIGGRYWARSSPNGPEGFGARVALTLLFPK